MHHMLISSPLSPSQKECETNPRREQKKAVAFTIPELAEEKSQSLHSQKSTQWAQQLCVTNENNRCSECHQKKTLYAGPKSTWRILTNLSPNLTRQQWPDVQLWDKLNSSSTNLRILLKKVLKGLTKISIRENVKPHCSVSKTVCTCVAPAMYLRCSSRKLWHLLCWHVWPSP